MLRHLGRGLAAALLLICPRALVAQASPYIPLDDPRLPLLEHLIARGDVADPSPMVRPFRRADAVRVLAAADTLGPSGAVVRRLLDAFRAPSAEPHWRVYGRVGGQAFSHARREVLHPAGRDGVWPYADLRAEAAFGPIVLATRPALEPRLTYDPDWPGRRDLELIGRMVEAYASAQFKFGSVFYGQLDRNWGPVGPAGIGLSDYGYSRVQTGIELGFGRLRLQALASDLRQETDNETGEAINRYAFAHRIGVRLSDRLSLGLWETTVIAGPARSFDGRYRNPLSLLLLANQYGLGADGNVLIGLDAHWRVARRATIQAQLAIDDLQYEPDAGYPNRWALTVTGFGALGPRLGWRAFYTQASSLAFRSGYRFEDLTDAGVGIGRNFADMDQVTAMVTLPVRGRWLLTPELTLLRQGEGRLTDPLPIADANAGTVPSLFIGTVERTWRVALGISGRHGPVDLLANAGYHHVRNARHVAGATANRFEGRLQVTVGLGATGEL